MAKLPAEGVIQVDRLLGDLGFDTPVAQSAARSALAAAGLTRPGKIGMSAGKRNAATGTLATLLVRHCVDERCVGWAITDPARRQRVPVSAAGCELCGGSNNRRAARLLLSACERARVRRVLIVGGSPGTVGELARELPGLEVRVVEGTSRPDEKRALADCGWAHVVVIWATTILDHKLSQLYTRGPHLTVARRGVEALCDELRVHLGG